MLELLAEGALPNNANHRPDTAAMLDQPVLGGLPLLGLYEFAQKRIPDMKYVSTKTFATALRKVGCGPVRLHAHQNRHGWQFLPLGEARRRFDEAFGAYEWPDDQKDWEPANREFRSPFWSGRAVNR